MNDISFFDKEKSTMIMGIAILLMIWHHFFSFPTWFSPGVNYNTHLEIIGKNLVLIPAISGNICVQIFAIISGYALFINQKTYSKLKVRSLKLIKFLISYWLVVALYMIIGFLNNDVLPSPLNLIKNMFGLKASSLYPWVNVPHAWYVAFYIQFLFISPILIQLFKGKNKIKDLLSIGLIFIYIYLVLRFPVKGWMGAFINKTHPLLCVGLGILLAKYNIFHLLHINFFKFIPSVIILLGIYCCMYIKYILPQLNPLGGNNWGYFMTIVFSFIAIVMISLFLELINRNKYLYIKKILILIGSLSMFLWFLHGIFHTGKNFMQEQIYSSKEPILIFTFALGILVPIAFLFSYINKKIFTLVEPK